MNYEKKIKTRLAIFIIYVLLGFMFVGISVFAKNTSSPIFSIGIAFIAVGVIKAVKTLRLLKNKEMMSDRQRMEQDERNIFLYEKARSLTFAVMICLLAVGMAVAYISGREDLGFIMALFICAECIIYIICYYIVKRKY